MATTLTLEKLKGAISGTAAALRSRMMLQPVGGQGAKIFPPTYAGAVYAKEKRRMPGHEQPVDCVLIDSVQSQANRMEEAMQQAVDKGLLQLPVIDVDFTPYWDPEKKNDQLNEDLRLLDPVGTVSSLQAPHRIADAILRDSLLDNKPFRQSDVGREINRVSLQNATAIFKHCPTALVFGMWDSTGPRGGLGAKFERAIVSEIVGIDAVCGVKTSSRIDPLGIPREAGPIYVAKDGGWTLDEAEAKTIKSKPVTLGKDGRPSEANHGNVTPSLSDLDRDTREYLGGGVTVVSCERTIVLSLSALRRLRFPVDGQLNQEVDAAAQTVLAALGLCAAALADETGLDLRSRCLLYPEGDLVWTLLDRKTGGEFTLSAGAAIELFHAATEEAKSVGLPWLDKPLILTPSKQLVKLVVKSQRLAMQQIGEE